MKHVSRVVARRSEGQQSRGLCGAVSLVHRETHNMIWKTEINGTGLVDAVCGSPRIKRVKRATSYVQNALPVLINPHSTHEPCHIIRILQPRDPKQKAWMTRPKTQKQPASERGSAGDSGGVQTGNIFTSLIKYNSVNCVWDGFILKTYFLGRWIVRRGKKKKDSHMDQKIWQLHW